jgi:CSLREA domain-containing protein
MYQLNDIETWREHRSGLLRETEEKRLARRLRPARSKKKRSASAAALGFLAAFMVAALMLVGASGPARAEATFTVTNTADPGDGICNAACTLREAITAANTTPGADTINFNIQPAGVVHTIAPSSRLPVVTEAVTINGYSQPGSSPNTLAKGTNARILIELNGNNRVNGLEIQANNTSVRGLVINRTSGSGISIDAGTGNRIEGNFLGTDASGTLDRGNFAFGAQIDGGRDNTIGGNSPFQRNLISGNGFEGVEISSNSAGGNKVQGNLIGTQKDGTSPLGNSDEGVYIDAPNNTIGGTGLGEANIIAFNGRDGVFVESNIANTGNLILANSILSNGGLGIDLRGGTENAQGATANDPKDPDQGPNALQNKPVLTSVANSGGKTTIQGRLNSAPNKIYLIQFFSNAAGNEGQKFLSQKAVTTDADGNVSFSFVPAQAVGVGQRITATATDSVKSNTSEFSAPRQVVAQ